MENNYLLRTIVEDENNEVLVDNYYFLNTLTDLVKKTRNIDPDKYQCFKLDDITNDVFLSVERQISKENKNNRKKMYESLKKEFEGIKQEG